MRCEFQVRVAFAHLTAEWKHRLHNGGLERKPEQGVELSGGRQLSEKPRQAFPNYYAKRSKRDSSRPMH